MPQNVGGEIGDFHRITVTFLQKAEGVGGICQQKLTQGFPVIQAVAEVNILGDIAHHRIGTSPDAEVQ